MGSERFAKKEKNTFRKIAEMFVVAWDVSSSLYKYVAMYIHLLWVYTKDPKCNDVKRSGR